MRFLALFPLLTASLLACTPDKDTTTETGTTGSTSEASTSTGSTGSTDSTSTSSTTAEPTGSTTAPATTDATTGTTAAPVDDCDFLVGKSFKSDVEMECGLGPNGPELCPWTLEFTADGYTHQYSDVGDAGTYDCEGGVITAVDGGQNPHGGTIDADTGELVWDDVVYHPAP